MRIFCTFMAAASSLCAEQKAPDTLRGFLIPLESKDSYGNPVRQGFDKDSALPLEIRHKVTGIHLVLCPPGSFMMGSPVDEKNRGKDETQHKVTLSQPFYIGKYEVTVGQFDKFVTATRYKTEAEAGDRSDTPWKKQFFSRDPDGPVVQVSWNDARKFCEWSGVSLPTEAQWEYACRAGTQSRFYFGDEDSKLGEYAWYYENSGGGVLKKRGTHPVGQKKPNAWGLYDMHGNAWEWCHDRYGDYPMTSVTDPARTTSGGNRVLRGGSWCNIPRNCRTADRIRIKPSGRLYSLGFRLVLAVQRK